jgi:hypothetical protein
MMTSAQGWVLLGLLAGMASGMLALIALSQANLKAFVGAKFDGVDARFNGVDRRLDDLDRDVQALSDRVFRDRP